MEETNDKLERKIQEANVLFGFAGVYFSARGFEPTNSIRTGVRLELIPEIRDTLEQRMNVIGTDRKTLFCFEDSSNGTSMYSVWDNFTEKMNSKRTYIIRIVGEYMEFPKEMGIKDQGAVFVGEREHFEIHYEEDWRAGQFKRLQQEISQTARSS